jgi:F-type H+-transporting ATPase subunit b
MEIDWFTLVAQVVNFLVLVFLLKFFLYDRIIGVIDKREEEISTRLEDSERTQHEAEQRSKSLQQEREKLRKKKAELIENAREEAEKNRDHLIEEARDEVDELKVRWMEGLQQQKKAFVKRFRRGAGNELLATARRVLGDLADKELDEAIVRAFIHRLHNMSEVERENMNNFIEEADEPVSVQSAFELTSEMKEQLLQALIEETGGKVSRERASFETATEALGGVELRAGGNRIGWSIETYLSSLEGFVSEALDRESGA